MPHPEDIEVLLVLFPGDTVDGQNPAPPKKPWNDILYKYHQAIVSHGFKVVQDFVHPQHMVCAHVVKSFTWT